MSDPDLLAALAPVLGVLRTLIVLAKLEWYRRGGEVSERQWTDVMGVLRAGGTALDLPYLRRGAAELEVGDLLDRALDEAEGAGTDR